MAVLIPTGAIKNLQQIEAVVAGPDDANRLFIIDGQFDSRVEVETHGGSSTQKEIFSVLVGPGSGAPIGISWVWTLIGMMNLGRLN